jgi:NhaA family Na+:H+ antiporter
MADAKEGKSHPVDHHHGEHQGKRPSLIHRLSVKAHMGRDSVRHFVQRHTHVKKDGRARFDNEDIAQHYSDGPGSDIIGVIKWLQENSIPLVLGVVVAMIIANASPDSYNYWFGGGIPIETDCTSNSTAHHRLLGSSAALDPCAGSHGLDHRRLSGGGNVDVYVVLGGCLNFFGHMPSLRFIANDMVICFFFGIAAKEITESLLPGGSLNPPSKAATPLIATLGGVFGPMAVFFTLVPMFYSLGMFDSEHEMALLHNGWGIVTATDIALAWVVAKKVFGNGHPAIDFLLLLAIADDGLGLIIVAIFYAPAPPQPQWLCLNVLAMGIAYGLRKWYYRKPKGQRIQQSWTTYVFVCGPISWLGLIKAHLHPALALCFVIPFLPGPEQENLEVFTKPDQHAHKKDDDAKQDETHTRMDVNCEKTPARTLEIQAGKYSGLVGHNLPKDLLVKGISAETGHEVHHGSCLDMFEHDCKLFVDMSLGFFALCNAGVQVKTFGGMAWSIYLSLLVGKIFGIVGCAKFGEYLGFPLPVGVSLKHLFMVGLIASIGLTVALFVSDAAFDDEGLKGEAKMGALCSAINGIIALVLGKFFDFADVHHSCPSHPESSHDGKESPSDASPEVSNPASTGLELVGSGHTASVI